MKFVDEYRDATIAQITTQPWAIMEICGGQKEGCREHSIGRGV